MTRIIQQVSSMLRRSGAATNTTGARRSQRQGTGAGAGGGLISSVRRLLR